MLIVSLFFHIRINISSKLFFKIIIFLHVDGPDCYVDEPEHSLFSAGLSKL